MRGTCLPFEPYELEQFVLEILFGEFSFQNTKKNASQGLNSSYPSQIRKDLGIFSRTSDNRVNISFRKVWDHLTLSRKRTPTADHQTVCSDKIATWFQRSGSSNLFISSDVSAVNTDCHLAGISEDFTFGASLEIALLKHSRGSQHRQYIASYHRLEYGKQIYTISNLFDIFPMFSWHWISFISHQCNPFLFCESNVVQNEKTSLSSNRATSLVACLI